FIDVAVQQIDAGAKPEQIESTRTVVGQIVDSYVGRIAQLQGFAVEQGQDPSQFDELMQFGEQQKQLFEESVSAAQLQREDTSEDFETVPPEEVAKLGFPEGAIVQRGPDNQVSLTFDPSTSLSAFQEKVDALTPFVGEEFAVGIAAGRFAVSTNPITNESVVLDKATGEQVGEVKPTPEPTAETPIIPTDIKTSAATGVKGIVINIANTLRDAFGMGLQDPEAQDATDALTTIQTLTSLHLLQEISGRDTDGLRKRLDKLTVAPNSFFQGEERSKNRIEDTQQVLQGEIDRMNNQLKTEIDPATRIKLQNNIPQIERLRDAYASLLAGFDKEEEEEEIDPAVKAALDEFAPIDSEPEPE
ncbi:hypothetical protein LCGC14_2897600, partial [marine sediment metagenome]